MRKLMLLAGLAVAGGMGGGAWGQTTEPGTPEKDAPAIPSSPEPLVKPEGGKPEAAKPEPASNQDPAAKEKFDQLEQAMKDLKSATFTASFSVDGRGKEMFGTIEAKVVARQGDKGWGYRTTGKGRRTSKSPENEFDISYADSNATWVDKEAKKLITKPAATARGKALDTASNLRSLGNLFQASPFSKERAAKELTLRDPEKVGEVECDVVVAVTGSAGGDMVFYLGKDDHLPRKVVSERTTSAGTTMSILELKDFKANDKVEASALEIALPEGFTREEAHSSTAKPSKTPEMTKGPTTDLPKGVPVPPGAEGGHAPSEVPATMPIEGLDAGEGGTTTVLPGTTPGPTGGATPPAPTAPAGDTAMPAFELKTLEGQAVTNESLRGQPAVIVFMGTWSMSSRKAYPEIKAVAERYKDKARVYAAAVRQRDPKDAKKALTEAGVDVPLLVSADHLAEQLKVGVFPAVYVIGADGEILKHPGSAKVEEAFAQARAALDAALGMAPPTPPPAPAAPAPTTPPVNEAPASGAEEEAGGGDR